ncbi:hypothetical protein [Mucilaginibacter rubeus]|uniref:Uncharacterized protein n=1 Tax=Mucilaginibacter rubeus TaxID=2027860 RepID=A0A5C1I3W6_9SPHI|nr:hypothetical protein [Mucilaginibacter rubeus]QEM12569.1 hypothetical protein DEO27_021995 [Mucilaginibacter rubeus]
MRLKTRKESIKATDIELTTIVRNGLFLKENHALNKKGFANQLKPAPPKIRPKGPMSKAIIESPQESVVQ